MTDPFGPERMYFNQFETIGEVENALRKVVAAGEDGFLIKYESIVDNGRILKTEPDERIYTKSVTLAFDDVETEEIFDYGRIQLTLSISSTGMPWIELECSYSPLSSHVSSQE